MFGDFGEDMSDPRQFCMHGTFVGTWWGPDYICGLCEDGATLLTQVGRERWTVVLSGTDKSGAPLSAEIVCHSAESAAMTVRQFSEFPNVTAEACVEIYAEDVWVVPDDRYIMTPEDDEEVII